jgi:hypothetical protein
MMTKGVEKGVERTGRPNPIRRASDRGQREEGFKLGNTIRINREGPIKKRR